MAAPTQTPRQIEDRLYTVLADESRRAILDELADDQQSRSLDELATAVDRNPARARLRLHHEHLPFMADAGVIRLDGNGNAVSLTPLGQRALEVHEALADRLQHLDSESHRN